MSVATSTPYEWLKKIPVGLARLDEVPLFGNPPPFPSEKVAALLVKALGLKKIQINISDPEWRPKESLFSGMGGNLFSLNGSIFRPEGPFFWVMSEKDIQTLISLIMPEGKELYEYLDEDYEEGFFRFLAIEALDAIQKSKWDPNIIPQLLNETDLPNETMLTIDVTMEVNDQKVNGRLFLPPALRKSIKEYYMKETANKAFLPPLSQKLELTVHLEAGRTSISLEEWKTVEPGDFVVLDQCTIIPGEDKGRVMLTIGGRPYFRGKIKDGNIKILEHPLYYEVNDAMKPNAPEDEDELEEDFDGEEDEEYEETDVSEIEEEEEEEEPKTTVQKAPQKSEAKTFSPKDIPISLVVEVGRLQMTVQTLLDTKPGNLLELNINPESGVDLVVNGSRVGKGELVKIGEVLGVRVLELG